MGSTAMSFAPTLQLSQLGHSRCHARLRICRRFSKAAAAAFVYSRIDQPTAAVNISSPSEQQKVKHGNAATRMVDTYDTTLRDGAQGEGISFSLSDKLEIAARLDAFGVSYIEGGCPTSNAKDAMFFEECKKLEMINAKVVAFGFTRHKSGTCELDKGIQALKHCGVSVVTLVAKAWDMQVLVVLETTLEENLAMIRDSVAYFKTLDKPREVMVDFEYVNMACI
jgi:hypothetical protein